VVKDLWLPIGYELPNGSKIKLPRYFDDDWQIFDTDGLSNILLAKPTLAQKWIDNGFLEDSLLATISFGTDTYRILFCDKKYRLSPIEACVTPDNKADALAFALTLKESRKLSKNVSFHDAIYVEQYSRLLPIWSLLPRVDDDVVLGFWITGGVEISTNAFRRMASLIGWMPTNDLIDIVTAAGLTVSEDISNTSKTHITDNSTDSKGFHESKAFKLVGRPQLESFFNEHVIDIIVNADKYKPLGINFPSAIVLHGPPGCGKTFATERLVEFLEWPSYSIDSGSVGSPYIHDTARKISQVFDNAIDNAPSVIVIDEMESFLTDRGGGGSSGLHHVEEVAEFLRCIPEANKNNVLIVAMTNKIDMIDPAILRRGRFDHIIKVDMPSKDEVSSLVEELLSKIPKTNDLNLNKVVDTLTGKPLSDVAFTIREAARLAAKAGKDMIDQESIDVALINSSKERKDTKRMGFGMEKK